MARSTATIKRLLEGNPAMFFVFALVAVVVLVTLIIALRPGTEDISIPEFVPEENEAVTIEETDAIIESEAEIPEIRAPEENESAEINQTPRGMEYSEYIVEEGDTFESVARSLGLGIETILSVNSVNNLLSIHPGLVLRYPPMDGKIYTVRAGESIDEIVMKRNPDISAEYVLSLNRIDSVEDGDEVFIPSPSAFSIPAQGEVITHYGDYNDGIMSDGVLIRTEGGSDVRASSGGTVIDKSTSEGLISVSLMHDDGYQSHYGNLSYTPLRISRKVQKGDVIGQSSEDGQLFFRITQNGIPIDPELIVSF